MVQLLCYITYFFSIKFKNLTPFNQNHPNSGSMDKYWGDWNIKHTFLTNQKNRPFGSFCKNREE